MYLQVCVCLYVRFVQMYKDLHAYTCVHVVYIIFVRGCSAVYFPRKSINLVIFCTVDSKANLS